MKGDLAEGVLPGVLRTLYIERKTGLLHVTRGEERGSVCFMKGNIVYGETNIKECHLGETLVRHGLLTAWDMERAGEMMTVTGRRMGQVLVDLGILDANGLEDALAMHVREVLLTVFSWREGSYRFDEQDPVRFKGYDRPLPLSIGEVILDAVWSIADPDVTRFGLGDLDRVLVPASDPLLRFQRLTLNATDGFLLSRVDGVSTAAQVLRMAPVSEEEAQRSLLGLVYTGMVEWAPELPKPSPEEASVRRQVLDAYARLKGQSHYAVLGVPENASRSEVHAAFVRLAKFYHPDAHHSPELLDLKDKLETLFWHVTDAYRVLFQESQRATPAPEAPTPAATPGACGPSKGRGSSARCACGPVGRRFQALRGAGRPGRGEPQRRTRPRGAEPRAPGSSADGGKVAPAGPGLERPGAPADRGSPSGRGGAEGRPPGRQAATSRLTSFWGRCTGRGRPTPSPRPRSAGSSTSSLATRRPSKPWRPSKANAPTSPSPRAFSDSSSGRIALRPPV